MNKLFAAYRLNKTKAREIILQQIIQEEINTFTVADIASEVDELPIQTVYEVFKRFVDAGILERCPSIDNRMLFKTSDKFKNDIQILQECTLTT